MNIADEFQSLSEAIESGTNSDLVYSTPIEHHDRTVVPVAQVEYGLGGGGGGGGGGADGVGGGGGTSGDDDDTEGGGLGGGLSARPAGALVVSDTGTRFVRPIDQRLSSALVIAGLVCGLVFSRLLRELGIGR
ncbi:spore germination protein GerW family protein [Halosimplex amylolyticum]|uniref:spore germination protein GerW family protein n=1 Tax=Halosimplex amylolyticum TaxID=3396616 RepID=UPI003F5604B7